MHSGRAFSRVLPAITIIALTVILGACSGGSGAGGSGGTGLDAALANVADTSVSRAQVAYDDTAALVKLSGTSPGATKGFALLRGWGASSLMDMVTQMTSDTGINVFNEDYAISAGNPPQEVTLLHGGQSASLVTSRLGKLGWKQGNGMLAGPSPAGGAQASALYALQMHVVRADGSDVRLGQSGVGRRQPEHRRLAGRHARPRQPGLPDVPGQGPARASELLPAAQGRPARGHRLPLTRSGPPPAPPPAPVVRAPGITR